MLADINGTSGMQMQVYATSVLATVRNGITKLEVSGYPPASIVLHPSDFEGVELALASTNAIERMRLPFDAASRMPRGPFTHRAPPAAAGKAPLGAACRVHA